MGGSTMAGGAPLSGNPSSGQLTSADLAAMAEGLRDIRRRIHMNPELSHAELGTAALVADLLRDWGWQVTRGVGGTGVVGSLTAGGGKRSIGLRADMDALPIHEETGLAHASRNPGAMHACGHDGHTAMLLGAARHLAAKRRFSGTVHLIFQPAEESIDSGARRMIGDGLFDRFPCDAVFGAHNHPGVEAGVFLFRKGPFMAACDQATITVEGTGGHAGRPHLAVDPVVIGASLVMALQTVVSRCIDPMQPAVVTVGSFHAGTVSNAIPRSAVLQLSIRSFSAVVRAQLRERISELAASHAASHGAHARVDYVEGPPVVVNSSEETDFAVLVAQELVGPGQVVAHADMLMGGEDFAFMLQQRPGSYLRIGNGAGAGQRMLHDPRYDFNDDILPVGAAYWARLVERYLAAQGRGVNGPEEARGERP